MSVQESPRRKSQRAEGRKRQEDRWARKSGPVLTYFDPSVIRPSKGSHGITEGERVGAADAAGPPAGQLLPR